MSYLAAIQHIDASLELSPYSKLTVSALSAGFETVFDAPVSSIAADAVTTVAEQAISSTVGQALTTTLGSIPLVGAILGTVAFAVGDLLAISDREKAHLEAMRRECAEQWARLKVVPTSADGPVPADLFAAYWSWSGYQELSEADTRAGKGQMPDLGRGLWLFGYGYPRIAEAGGRPYILDPRSFKILRKRARVLMGDVGPTDQRRRLFRLLAESAALARCVQACETDGAVTLLPILMDVVRDQQSRTTPGWIDFMSTHSVAFPSGEEPKIYIIEPRECSYTPALIATVAEMRRRWGLKVDPVYKQERAEAEKLRAEVDARVRSLLRAKIKRGIPGLIRRVAKRPRPPQTPLIDPGRWPFIAGGVALTGALGLGFLYLLRERERERRRQEERRDSERGPEK